MVAAAERSKVDRVTTWSAGVSPGLRGVPPALTASGESPTIGYTPQRGSRSDRPRGGGVEIARWYRRAACAVAQSDSALVFGTEGWGFKSLRAYFILATVGVVAFNAK